MNIDIKKPKVKFKNELTLYQAKQLIEAEIWENMTSREIAEFQINTDRLCMPFSVFHTAVTETLGRTVMNVSLAISRDSIIKEMRGERPALTLENIVGFIPEEQRKIVALPEGE